MQLLLDYGTNINHLEGQFGTALQAPSCTGRLSNVQLLLGNGANVNAIGGYFETALQSPSAHDHQTIVQLLLQSGTEVNTRGKGSECGKSQEVKNEIIHLLLEHGAVKLESQRSSTDEFFSTD